MSNGKTLFSFLIALTVFGLPATTDAQPIPQGFERGGKTVWIEGDRPDILVRDSEYRCPVGPADSSPDSDTWLTVDTPILAQAKARAAIVFVHAWAEQDGQGESNGISVHLSKDGTTGLSPSNQAAQTKARLANDGGDEHAMMIVDLDKERNFKMLYHFGEMFESDIDETLLCWWGARIQLLGWIEGGKNNHSKDESSDEKTERE